MSEPQRTHPISINELLLFAAQIAEEQKSIENALELLQRSPNLEPLYVFGLPSYHNGMKYLAIFTKELKKACVLAATGNPQTAQSSKARVKADSRANMRDGNHPEGKTTAKSKRALKTPPKLPGVRTAAEMYDPAKAAEDDALLEEAKREARKMATKKKLTARKTPNGKAKSG